MFKRAKFYSVHDLANGAQLSRAETVLRNFDPSADFSLVDAIELYNIKLLLDNGLRLQTWSDRDFEEFKKTSKTFGKHIVKALQSLDKSLDPTDSDSIPARFKQLSFDYQEDFWTVLEAFGQIDILDDNTVSAILADDPYELQNILHCKKQTERFDTLLADFMRQNPAISMPVLVDTFLTVNDDPTHKSCHIPKSLTVADREKILLDYTALPDAHPTTLRLINSLKDDPTALVAGPKTRLAAIRKAEAREKELFNQNSIGAISMGFEMIFAHIESGEPIKAETKDSTISITVNESYLDSLDDYGLMHFFYWLGFLNDQDFIALTYNPNHSNILEKIADSRGKNSYPTNQMFSFYNNIAQAQVQVIENYLSRKNRGSLEGLLKRFYESVIYERYGVKGVPLSLPQPTDLTINKIKTLAPEIESLMKQYNLLCEEGTIDPDLFAIAYGMHLVDAKSLVEHKYAYVPADAMVLRQILFLLFSDQSNLCLGRKWSHHTNNMSFAERIASAGKIGPDELENYQVDNVKFLTDNGILAKDSSGNFIIADPDMFHILSKLHERPEISYWHQEPDRRKAIDSMVTKGWLKTDDHLLSPMERDYMDYYLNDHKFSNGLSLRNRYLHGVGAPASPEQQTSDYYTLLKIMILLLLKINSDLSIHRHLTTSNP